MTASTIEAGGRKPGSRRTITLTLKNIRARLRAGGAPDDLERALMKEVVAAQPRCRAECIDGPRPCIFISCKHHLYVDVNPSTGSIKFNFPDKEIWELAETCALDVADRGGSTLDAVGALLNVTRERVRQIETRGLQRLAVGVGGKK